MLPIPKKRIPVPVRKSGFKISVQDKLFHLGEKKSEYTSKIKAPIYTPSGKIPELIELVNTEKSKSLIRLIDESPASEEEKKFLRIAAGRHNVFNYKLIADYYANSLPEIQRLMEQSALVIIDFRDAIQFGYVKYSKDIAAIYGKEKSNE